MRADLPALVDPCRSPSSRLHITSPRVLSIGEMREWRKDRRKMILLPFCVRTSERQRPQSSASCASKRKAMRSAVQSTEARGNPGQALCPKNLGPGGFPGLSLLGVDAVGRSVEKRNNEQKRCGDVRHWKWWWWAYSFCQRPSYRHVMISLYHHITAPRGHLRSCLTIMFTPGC